MSVPKAEAERRGCWTPIWQLALGKSSYAPHSFDFGPGFVLEAAKRGAFAYIAWATTSVRFAGVPLPDPRLRPKVMTAYLIGSVAGIATRRWQRSVRSLRRVRKRWYRRLSVARRRGLPPLLVADRVLRLSPAWVETGAMVVFTDEGYVASTLRRQWFKVESLGYRMSSAEELSIPKRREVTIDTEAVLIGAPFGTSYYHWLFNCIGRYVAFRRELEGLPVVVNSGLPHGQFEALSLVGIDSVLRLPARSTVRFPVLHVPPGATDSTPSPAVLAAVRALRPDSTASRRLYVSRQQAKCRRIVNHDDVLRLVGAFGFEVIRAEELPFAEQIEVFSKAAVILGAHGAGLANIVFAPPEAKVIELQPEGYGPTQLELFGGLSRRLGLAYFVVDCQRVQFGDSTWKHDLMVDCARLEHALVEATVD